MVNKRCADRVSPPQSTFMHFLYIEEGVALRKIRKRFSKFNLEWLPLFTDPA